MFDEGASVLCSDPRIKGYSQGLKFPVNAIVSSFSASSKLYSLQILEPAFYVLTRVEEKYIQIAPEDDQLTPPMRDYSRSMSSLKHPLSVQTCNKSDDVTQVQQTPVLLSQVSSNYAEEMETEQTPEVDQTVTGKSSKKRKFASLLEDCANDAGDEEGVRKPSSEVMNQKAPPIIDK